MPDASPENRREDFRIVDVLYMREEPLSASEFEARKQAMDMPSRISSSLRNMLPRDVEVEQLLQHSDVPGELVRALETLDAKLNYLISVHMINEAERHRLQEHTIDISTTGMSFFSEHLLQAGQAMQVVLVVPTAPLQIMELLAEVKWVRQEEDGRPRVGVAFCFRNMEERDGVARYVFRRHREMIRLQEEPAD